MAKPGTRRIYSNYGFAVLAETIEQASGIEFDAYLTEAVFEPLGMADTALDGGAEAAGYGATSTVADLVAFAGDLLRPCDGLRSRCTPTPRPCSSRAGRGAARLRRRNGPTTGVWASRSGTANRRTGPGRRNSARDVRPFRPVGHVSVGRSGRRAGAGGADRPQIRRLGAPVMAGAL